MRRVSTSTRSEDGQAVLQPNILANSVLLPRQRFCAINQPRHRNTRSFFRSSDRRADGQEFVGLIGHRSRLQTTTATPSVTA